MDNEFAIKILGLKKSFKDLQVLKDINLNVKRGTILALLGPNGAGKTTTVRILSTLIMPDEGQVLVNGHDVVQDPNGVRASIGLTGQYAAVDEYLNAVENLEMMGKLYHLPKEVYKKRSEELLNDFELENAATRQVKTYSGGMRRRLDLALSLIARPPIIFLDEPTTGLDPRSRLAMWRIIEKMKKEKVTILLTTQYLEEADKLADRIAVLDHGKIITEGTSDELKAKVGKERLEVIIKEGTNFESAKKIIDGEAMQADEDKRTISVAIGSMGDVKQILDSLERSKIDVETMNLHKPTLDDVFLQFTGHQAEGNNEQQ